jgi:hypothetical protein
MDVLLHCCKLALFSHLRTALACGCGLVALVTSSAHRNFSFFRKYILYLSFIFVVDLSNVSAEMLLLREIISVQTSSLFFIRAHAANTVHLATLSQ